jgi:hypothetical protein
MWDPASKDLIIATKEEEQTRLYRVPSRFWMTDQDKPRSLEFILVLPFQEVSGGDISPDGREWVLRREESARLLERPVGNSVVSALNAPGRSVPVIGPPEEPNGEAIGFHPKSEGYYTISEEPRQPIYFFRRR